MISRALHAMAPSDPLLLDLALLLVLMQAGRLVVSRRRRIICRCSVRAAVSQLLVVLPRRRDGVGRQDIQGLEEELAPNLPLVAGLERQPGGDVLEPLDDRLDGALEQRLLHVGRARAERQRLDHAQLRVELRRRVRVDGERAARRGRVRVDQARVAAADHGDERADRQAQEGVGRYGGGQGA